MQTASGIDTKPGVRHLRSKNRQVRHGWYPVVTQTRFFVWVNYGYPRPGLTGVMQVFHRDWLIVGRIRTLKNNQVCADPTAIRACHGTETEVFFIAVVGAA